VLIKKFTTHFQLTFTLKFDYTERA